MREDSSVEVIKKTLCVYFFFGKRSEENNNFWTQKLGYREKQKKNKIIALSQVHTLTQTPFFLKSPSTSKKNNLSMKNKFNIKGSQFFIFLFPNPPLAHFYISKNSTKKKFRHFLYSFSAPHPPFSSHCCRSLTDKKGSESFTELTLLSPLTSFSSSFCQ